VTSADKLILFEPWNMGDALIAAAIALQNPARLALACNSRWHDLIRAAAEGLPAPELLTADVSYVNRGRKGRWDFGSLPAISTSAERSFNFLQAPMTTIVSSLRVAHIRTCVAVPSFWKRSSCSRRTTK